MIGKDLMCIETFMGVHIIERDHLGTYRVPEFAFASELGAIDEDEIEIGNSVQVLDMFDAIGRLNSVAQVLHVLLQPAEYHCERRRIQIRSGIAVEKSNFLCTGEF